MKTIPLTKGHIAMIDDGDYDLVSQWKWHAKESIRKDGSVSNVYAKRRKWSGRKKPNGDLQSLHRLIMQVDDPKIEIDHKNGNGLDCQRSNLRIATPAQNKANLPKCRRNGYSKYKGVGFHLQSGLWRARVKHYGKDKTWFFYGELEAAVAYDYMALNAYKEFACTNFQRCPLVFYEDISSGKYNTEIVIDTELTSMFSTVQ